MAMAMAHVDPEEGSVMTPTAGHILQLLPRLSTLPLASKWRKMLEFQMEDDMAPGKSLNKSLALSSSSWERFQKAVFQEERADVADVLAKRGVALLGPGKGEEWRRILLCFFMALIPSSSPRLHRLRLHERPGDSSEETKEAFQVFYRALRSPEALVSSVRHLSLCFDKAFGEGESCGQLGRLLRSSHCSLQTLEFRWVRSLNAEGIGVISWGLQSESSTLTKLAIVHCSEVRDAGVKLLADMLLINSTLQELVLKNVGMGGNGVAHICEALSESRVSGLNTLKISWNPRIQKHGALPLGRMLACNPPVLRRLKVRGCHLQDSEGHLARGLQENKILEELDISENKMDKKDLELLFSCLASRNSSLKKLRIAESGEMPASEKLASMIASNSSIQHLDLSETPVSSFDFYYSKDWAAHILPAVATNRVLQSLDMSGCKGIDGKAVQKALLKLLQVNITIRQINLDETPLYWSGKAAAVEKMLLRNKGYEYGQISVTMPESTPTPRTCRIILCGGVSAGKSTLLHTLRRVYTQLSLDAGQQGLLDSDQRINAWGHKRRRSYFLPSHHDKQLSGPTSGIDIHVLMNDEQNGRRVSACDFAGQLGYRALHHFMFPKGNRGAAIIFVYTFNPIQIRCDAKEGKVMGSQVRQIHAELKRDFSNWLKFVASNSRPDSPPPQVVVVITNRDRLARKLQNLHEFEKWLDGAHQIISTLADVFRGVVKLRSERPFVVKAFSANDPDIRRWVEDMEESFRSTLLGLQEVPSFCYKVAKALRTAAAPIVTTQEFADTCRKEDGTGRTPLQSWEVVAAYLHDVGEVLYHDKLSFIVQNPRWFGRGILGHLMDVFTPVSQPPALGLSHKMLVCCYHQRKKYDGGEFLLPGNGYVSRASLVNLLEKALEKVALENVRPVVNADDLIQLMLLLNLCYEMKKGDPRTGYFLPAFCYDAQAANDERPLNWQQPSAPNSTFAGRRLECDDVNRTFLPDSFFPLIQVMLCNYARQELWKSWDARFLISEKNLVAIMVKGMEVMVEYSSSRGSVDILVKSSKSHAETMQFVELHFVNTIRGVCASEEGCPGVSLSEAIIRPACCGEGRSSPVLCAYRKEDQVIAVSELKRRMEKHPNYVHSWPKVVDGQGANAVGAGKDSAALLMGEEDYPSPSKASVTPTTHDLPNLRGHHGYYVHITTEDVPDLHQTTPWTQFSRVVPLRFYPLNVTRERKPELKKDQSLTFYLVDDYTRYTLEQTTGVDSFVASALEMVPGVTGAGSALSSLPLKDGTPIYWDTVESLSKRVTGKVVSEVTVEDLRLVVLEDMAMGRSGEWIRASVSGDSSMESVRESLSKRVTGKEVSEVTVEDLLLPVLEDMAMGRSGEWIGASLSGDSSMKSVHASNSSEASSEPGSSSKSSSTSKKLQVLFLLRSCKKSSSPCKLPGEEHLQIRCSSPGIWDENSKEGSDVLEEVYMSPPGCVSLMIFPSKFRGAICCTVAL